MSASDLIGLIVSALLVAYLLYALLRGSRPAASISSPYSNLLPMSAHERRQHCSIHNPITFLSRRVVPHTPPSFEKFNRCDWAVTIGASSSIPS